MSGECTVTEGKTYDTVNGEVNSLAKLNLVAKPSVRVNADSIGTRELTDASVTSDKLAADVLSQINAEAIIGNSSITSAKIANGAVTLVKLNQDVLDVWVTRDAVTTTVGSFLRYVDTTGGTEEVTLSEILNSTVRLDQYAEYNTTSTTAITSGGVRIDYGTLVKDDGTNVTTGGSWVYTVPETGLYSINASIGFSSLAAGSVANMVLTAGSRSYRNRILNDGSTSEVGNNVSTTTYLTASQTVYVTGY